MVGVAAEIPDAPRAPRVERAAVPPRMPALPDYLIKPGDVLDVMVWQTPEASRDVTVRPDGKISYPLAGELIVAHKTVPQVEELFTEALSRYVKAPSVSVVVTAFAGNKVMVLGEVSRPGQYRYHGPTTLVEVLGLASGYTDSASFEDVTVTRVTGDEIHVDLNRLLFEGDWRHNVWIESGDVVRVARAKRAFILGEVMSPGAYSLGRKDTAEIFDMVMKAGGPTPQGQMGSVRRIRQVHEKKPQVVMVDLRRVAQGGAPPQKVLIAPGDVIYVPRSTLSKVTNLLANLDRALTTVATGQGIVYGVDFHRWAKQGQGRAELSEERAVTGEARAVAGEARAEESQERAREGFELAQESQEFLRQRMTWEQERFEVWESE